MDFLFPLHLFCLVGFYHAPSSAACFSVFSFCLINCVWGLLSRGCKVVVIPMESTPSVWGWTLRLLGWRRGTSSCVLVGEAGSCLSKGSVWPNAMLRGVCELGVTLGSLSTNGYSCVPVLLVV